ncbi:RES domain protein [compost metagenome]
MGNALAARARAEGLNGIIYPSVRHPGGTCLVALRPAAVQSVRQGDVYRMIWRGRPEPIVEGPV